MVLSALEQLGLADDTLVICTTDHGIAFPGAKTTLTDRGIGVFLIMRGPGGFEGGKVIDAMVSHIDVFPTICELVGIERPEFLQGESLLPLVRGERTDVRDAIFAEGTYHAAYEPQRAVRTERWKYIRRFLDHDTPVPANTDDSPTKDYLIRHGWLDERIDSEQLYDLVFDPNEAHNLAGEPHLEDTLKGLRALLEEWMRETADPLLDGTVPPPPGAEFNDPDQLSPEEPTHIVAPLEGQG
jgi:arylsulfatase A-like enzyme